MNDCYLSFKNIDDDNEERFNQYYIPGTKVLRNFLNITNSKKLRAYEQRLVLLNYAKAINVNKTYDFEHIIAIHQALFGNIYPFAGELRQANMGKTIQGEVYYQGNKNSMFLDYTELPYHIAHFNHYIKSKNYLSGIKDKLVFAKELCDVYLFINDIHAFREGNGRTQNEFIRQLAEKNGFILNVENAMNKFKQQGINYYQWFYHYQLNNQKDEILHNLFLDHIKTLDEYKQIMKLNLLP